MVNGSWEGRPAQPQLAILAGQLGFASVARALRRPPVGIGQEAQQWLQGRVGGRGGGRAETEPLQSECIAQLRAAARRIERLGLQGTCGPPLLGEQLCNQALLLEMAHQPLRRCSRGLQVPEAAAGDLDPPSWMVQQQELEMIEEWREEELRGGLRAAGSRLAAKAARRRSGPTWALVASKLREEADQQDGFEQDRNSGSTWALMTPESQLRSARWERPLHPGEATERRISRSRWRAKQNEQHPWSLAETLMLLGWPASTCFLGGCASEVRLAIPWETGRGLIHPWASIRDCMISADTTIEGQDWEAWAQDNGLEPGDGFPELPQRHRSMADQPLKADEEVWGGSHLAFPDPPSRFLAWQCIAGEMELLGQTLLHPALKEEHTWLLARAAAGWSSCVMNEKETHREDRSREFAQQLRGLGQLLGEERCRTIAMAWPAGGEALQGRTEPST